ncbi:tandem-95 repeat protein [Candidatus Gracilibacteria bacterium]|nr:tandem-95 repeat protein [Candidatus Gracilibacteria bacterium]
MIHTHISTRGIAILVSVTFMSQIFSPFIPLSHALNNAYYVNASTGNDANDGLSPDTPWQTISQVNASVFSEGDAIYFNCGDTWNEQLDLQYSGVEGNPIFYGPYGDLCDGTNNPVIEGVAGVSIIDSVGVSHVTLSELVSTGGTIDFTIPSSSATGVVLQSMSMSHYLDVCFEQDSEKVIDITNTTFQGCNTAVSLGQSGTVSITDSIFSDIGTGSAIRTSSTVSNSSLVIQGNSFSNIQGNAITFTSNTLISQNTFSNICSLGVECSALSNDSNIAESVNISQNAILGVGTGVVFPSTQAGIFLTDTASGVTIEGNTLSDAQVAVRILGARGTTASGNTLFNPRAEAIIVQDTLADQARNNQFMNNTILSYNPDYSMIKVEDLDSNLSIASFSNNSYINIYKGKLPIIDSISQGGNSYSYDKDTLTDIDPTASNFTHFGYKNYTNTGSYPGFNLISNSQFGTDISLWTSDRVNLTYDSTGQTLHGSQLSSTGMVSSNAFSIVSGGVYEVSGLVRNTIGTGGIHAKFMIRQDDPGALLYVDREIDVISTASGKTFRTYVTAQATASDAKLDIEVSNPLTSIELDNIVVRRVTGLTYNPRTYEARLLVNTGSSSSDFACPGSGGCPLQYRDLNDNAVTFPMTIGAHDSRIILWRDPNSSFTPTNIQYRPTGSIVPSAGSIPNNDPIDLTWTSNNATSIVLNGVTLTGAFSYSVDPAGTVSVNPPGDAITTYRLNLENDIGVSEYTADVVTSNTPPVADPAFVTGLEDALSITGVVTATDINSGGTISYSLFDPPLPGQGSINIFNSDGTFDFLPAPNYCGIATFSFRAFDAFGLGSDAISPGMVTVTITCTNDDPVAIDDSFTATGGVSNLIDVLTNEADIDSTYEVQTFFLTGFTSPSHGTLSITGNVFDYVPDAFYVGSDSFTYTMVDQSGGLSNTGTVTLSVIPGSNLPPFAASDSFTITEDDSFTATLSGYDLNPGDILTYTAVTLPSHGIVSVEGSGFTYTPNVDFNGSDSFTFVTNDSALTSSDATISFSVTGTPDTPVVVDDIIGIEMSADVALNLLANDTDGDSPYSSQSLTVTGYTLPSHGTLTLVGSDLHYVSEAPYLGSDSFTYAIADFDGNISNTGTVTLNITSTNTPPIVYSGAFSTDEDVVIVGTLSGFDVDATPLTFILGTDVSNGVLHLGSTGAFVYTPNQDYNGLDSFTIQVTDGVFSSSFEEISLTILPVNDAPVIGHDTGSGVEDTILVLTGLLDNDSDIDDGDTFALSSILTQGTKGTATISGSTMIIYTPIQDTCGLDTFTYQIADQSGATSGSGNVAVDLQCTNDAPTVSDSNYTMTGNVLTQSGLYLSGGLSGSDIDLDTLTYTLGSGTTHGGLIFNTGGSFSYTPAIGFTGSDSFTYSATDGLMTTGIATVSITVNTNNHNTVPVAYSGLFITNEDTLLVGSLSGTDLEGTPLVFSLGSGATHGIIALTSTGQFTYTPSANYSGGDSFTFRVSDGVYSSTYETGSITVLSVNDIPSIVGDSISGIEDSTIIIPVLANDTDVDGTVVSITGLTQPLTGGILSIVGTGVQLVPFTNYCSSTPVTFNYVAVDNLGASSSSGTGSFTISCVSDNPVAVDDSQTSSEDASFTILALANDTDADIGDTVTVSSYTQPSTGGTITTVTGGFRFTPVPNFCSASPITFTYRARDTLNNLSNTGTVALTINCVNDVPVSQDVSLTMTGNVLSGSLSTLITQLSASDVDGDVLHYSLTAPVSTGSVVLSSTGTFNYIPPVGFVGSATGGYSVSDGTSTGTVSSISVCVISPNSTIPLPSCAPGAIPQETVSTSGPGGGGGGGGGGGSSSDNSNNSIIVLNSAPNDNANAGSSSSQLYMPVTGGSGVSSQLLSQLMYGKIKGQWNETQESYNQETQSEEVMNIPYAELLDVITSVLDYSRELSFSSLDNVRDIRTSGQDTLKSIHTSEEMTQSEKADALREAAQLLTEYLNPEPFDREYRALQYVIRILKARETIIRDTLDTLSEFMMESEENY